MWLLVSRARCERNHWAIRENVGEEFLGNRVARSLNARSVAAARCGQWTAVQVGSILAGERIVGLTDMAHLLLVGEIARSDVRSL